MANGTNDKYIPEIRGNLKKNIVSIPDVTAQASGIKIHGRILRSFLFSTDVAFIRNSNADAVIAIYPFLPQPVITQAVLIAANVPVFCGVNGTSSGDSSARIVNLAKHAEYQGASGVVVHAETPNALILEIAQSIAIPIILTVASEYTDFKAKLEAGVSVLNVSGSAKTPQIIQIIRQEYPYVPLLATGGPNEETIRTTIEAGANAITYTPPSSGNVFSAIITETRNREHPKK